ncbi:hypothetical protein Mgra_00003806 [Meloidogyne graminicola]|uniref:Uncharacterized protein n=1 Tax=Meloidogyne graminicola TaxID=189291 RepID=A0A8S9ZUR3_9BILA|nr:hypothetical protein Mgra_00003806 [Meloidogyne graminicola]
MNKSKKLKINEEAYFEEILELQRANAESDERLSTLERMVAECYEINSRQYAILAELLEYYKMRRNKRPLGLQKFARIWNGVTSALEHVSNYYHNGNRNRIRNTENETSGFQKCLNVLSVANQGLKFVSNLLGNGNSCTYNNNYSNEEKEMLLNNNNKINQNFEDFPLNNEQQIISINREGLNNLDNNELLLENNDIVGSSNSFIENMFIPNNANVLETTNTEIKQTLFPYKQQYNFKDVFPSQNFDKVVFPLMLNNKCCEEKENVGTLSQNNEQQIVLINKEKECLTSLKEEGEGSSKNGEILLKNEDGELYSIIEDEIESSSNKEVIQITNKKQTFNLKKIFDLSSMSRLLRNDITRKDKIVEENVIHNEKIQQMEEEIEQLKETLKNEKLKREEKLKKIEEKRKFNLKKKRKGMKKNQPKILSKNKEEIIEEIGTTIPIEQGPHNEEILPLPWYNKVEEQEGSTNISQSSDEDMEEQINIKRQQDLQSLRQQNLNKTSRINDAMKAIADNFEGIKQKDITIKELSNKLLEEEIIIQKNNLEFLLKQNYALGIAEFTQQIGAFQVFNALKIQKTIDVSSSRIPDDHLKRIDPSLNFSQISAKLPSDTFWTEDYELNNKYKELVETFPDINWAMPINIFDTFQNINFHFSNHHFFAKVFPEHPKVGYIGGILVEEKEILIKDKTPTDDNYSCAGLFSMGTLVPLQEENIVGIKVMFKTMATEYSKNIEVFDEFIPQQELLAKQNMRIFISHCVNI